MTYQLTRIKNNNITDSTILANTKIVPGSIVGSLFNSNLTMTSDVTITGNLTVQGSSTYLTVASTNTYVNDPLIILNNAFSGTNTYDIGLLFNRGNQTSTALIWNEDNNEFRAIFTSDDGSTYGTINNSGYANIRLGSLSAEQASIGALSLSGDINANNLNLSGDLLIAGQDLTANTTSFNLLDTTVTTANVLSSATLINLGASTGTLNLNNADVWLSNATTLDSGASTVTLFDTPTTATLLGNATSLTIGGGATSLELGSTSGTANIRNSTTNILGNATVGGTLNVTGETTLASATVSDLTSGRVVLAGTAGVLEDSSNLTFDGTKLTVNGNVDINTDLTVSGATNLNTVQTTGSASVGTTLDVTGNITGGNLTTSGHTSTNTLTASGKVTAQGNVDVQGDLAVSSSVTARDLNSTVIGNVTPESATFTTLTAQSNVSLGLTEAAAINNTPIGNATPSTGVFTTLTDIALTSGRVLLAGAGGELVDDAEFTYESTNNILGVGNVIVDGANRTIATDTGNLTVFAFDGNVVFNNNNLKDVADPIDLQDVVTLAYLNQQISSAVTNIQSDNTDISIHDDSVTAGSITSNVDATTWLNVTSTELSLFNNSVAVNTATSNVAINTTDLYVTSGSEFTGLVDISNTTNSTASANGALVVAGGVGVGGSVNVDGELNVANNTSVTASTASTNSSTGALVVTGGVGVGGNLNVNDNLNIGKDVVVYGNLTVEGTTTALNTSTLDVEDLNITVAKGATSSSAADGAGLTVDGANATLTYAQADDSWNVNKLFNGTSAAFNGTLTARDIQDTVIGNVTPAAGYFTNLTSTGSTSLGLTEAAAINNTPIGNAVASSGAFTTLDASGIVQFTDTSAATSVGTGALRVAGGASVSGNLFIGGNVNFVGSSYVLTGNSGVFYGDINGFSALYAGVTGYTALPQTVFQTSANFNGYVQNNFQNLNTGPDASTDWVATAGDGSDYNHYIDMGITTSNWDGTQDNSLTNAVGANDGYLYVQGNIQTGVGGNLTIGASTSGTKKVSVIVGGNTASSITAVFNNPNTDSTSTTTGALTVAGGVGVNGNLHALNITTNTLTSTDLVLSGDLAVNGGDLTTTASTFNLLNSNATTVNFAGATSLLNIGGSSGTVSINGSNIWLPEATSINSTQSSVTLFSSATDWQIGATSGQLLINNPTIKGDSSTQDLWNTVATTINFAGAASNLNIGSTSGVTTINTPTVSGSQTVANLWNTTATTVNFAGEATTLNIGADSGTVNINNDTVNLEGNVNVNKSTPSTSTSTGALVVDGGVGIGGNVNIGEKLQASGTVHFTDTTVSTQYNNGAVIIGGGVGVNGNIHIDASHYLTVGAELVGSKLPNSVAEFYSNANIGAFVGIQNTSTGPSASSSFIVRSNDAGFAAFGIANSNYNEGIIVKPHDAYLFNEIGNVYIGTQTAGKNLGLMAGGNTASALTATVTNAGIDIHSTTSSTSTTSGALTVAGGVGISGSIWAGNGAVINNSQTAENFTVKGQQTTTLIHADSTYGAVVIGGSNASPQLGATLKINSTDALMIPVGATAERPSNSGNVDVQGMIRFNTSTSSLEFYNGSIWSAAGSDTTFTIISNEQFTGNGAANTYALSRNTTTSGAVVSINGILQIPTLAYSITGSTLQFTENPADGDLIDVRIITTTQTVGDVTSPNGLNAFTPDNTTGAAIYSGTTAGTKAVRATAKPDGTWAYVNGTKTTYDQVPVTVSSASTAVKVDEFTATEYTSAKYVVQVKQSTGNVQIMEALVVHDGGNAYVSTYGVVDTNGSMGTLSANVVSGNVRLYYTSTSLTNSNVKVYSTYIV